MRKQNESWSFGFFQTFEQIRVCKLFYSYFILFSFSFFSANSMTLAWLSNNMSADYEDVHVPVKKTKPKQAKVVTFWCAELRWLNILLIHWLTNSFSRI